MKTFILIVALLGALALAGDNTSGCESKKVLTACKDEMKAVKAAYMRNDTNLMADLATAKATNDFAGCKANFVGCQETLCEITLMGHMQCDAIKEIFSCVYKECGCGEWEQKGFLRTIIDEVEMSKVTAIDK